MKRSSQIVAAVVGFLLGIVLASYFLIDQGLVWVLVAVLGIIILYRTSSRLGYIVLVGLGLILGVWRQNVFVNMQPAFTIDSLQRQKVSVVGTVVGEPSWNDEKQYVYYLNNLSVDSRPVSGSIKVRSLSGNAEEGYRIMVEGKLYPALGKTNSQIFYAKSTVLSTRVPWYIDLKQRFWKGLQISLGQPAAGFMMGVLIGSRSALPKEIQDLLATVGLSHVIAVSGYNLTIIIVLVNRLIGRSWRWAGLITSLWLSAGFVVLSGASASIVRAAVMGAVFLLCRYFGRRLNHLAGLAIGALLTVGYSPSYLLTDLGWQLSFLSLLGIILFAPVFTSLLPKRTKLLSEISAVTLAAQIMTAPLLAYKFGYVSLIGPLANLLIMPLIPLLMLLGFVAGLIGIILPQLAYQLMIPVRFVVLEVLDLVRYLAGVSWSRVGQSPLPGRLLLGSYLCLLALTMLFMRRRKSLPSSNLI